MKKRNTTTKKSKARKTARRKATAVPAKRRGRKSAAGAKRRAAAATARSRRKATKKRRTPAPKKRTRVAAAAGDSVERPRARLVQGWRRGLGGEAAGQSGDLEAIPRGEDVDSESVEELLEEGQSWEAGIVSGVESEDDEEGQVRTHEVPEDDVPEEYRDEKH
jgi:hypothetical protein